MSDINAFVRRSRAYRKYLRKYGLKGLRQLDERRLRALAYAILRQRRPWPVRLMDEVRRGAALS